MLEQLKKFIIFVFKILFAVYRDLIGVVYLLKVNRNISNFQKDNANTATRFRELVKKHPKKACIIFNDETWTFQDVISDFYSTPKQLSLIFFSTKEENLVYRKNDTQLYNFIHMREKSSDCL